MTLDAVKAHPQAPPEHSSLVEARPTVHIVLDTVKLIDLNLQLVGGERHRANVNRHNWRVSVEVEWIDGRRGSDHNNLLCSR